MQTNKKPIYRIAECGIFIALACALSLTEIEVGTLGGDISFVMIPLFIICYRQGAGYGIMSGFVFGFLKCLIGGGIGYGLPSVLFDYVLAYGACGIAGFFRGKKKLMELSVFLGCAARYIIHVISGVTLYRITAPENVKFFGEIANPWLYSFAYNIVYMLPNTIIAIAAVAVLHYPLAKLDKI